MVQKSPVKLHWKQRIHFHVEQGKHCSDTRDFTYFHASRAQYIAKGVDYASTLKAQGVPQADLDKLTNVNVSTTEASETATSELDTELKETKIDEKASEAEKKSAWRDRINDKNEEAKKKVNDAMDAGRDAAVDLIDNLPEGSQDDAANFFIMGVDVAMEAFDYMTKKIAELYSAVTDFIKKVWTAITKVWNAVTDKVGSCVKKLFGFKATADTGLAVAKAGSSLNVGDGYTGNVFQLSWNIDEVPYNIYVATLYLWQRYQAIESKFDTWFTDLALQNNRWVCYFGVTDCENVQQAGVAMNVVLDIERSRRVRVPGEEWSKVPTPDPVSYQNVINTATADQTTGPQKTTNGTANGYTNGADAEDDYGYGAGQQNGNVNAPFVNRLVTLSFDAQIPQARMRSSRDAIWDSYRASGGASTGVAKGEPGPDVHGRREVTINWSHGSNIAAMDTRMSNACKAEEAVLTLAYHFDGDPLTFVIGAGGAQGQASLRSKKQSEDQIRQRELRRLQSGTAAY